MRIFLICKVRGCSSEEYERQRTYVEERRGQGDFVHWPHRDTKQKDPTHGTAICRTTFWAIFGADEIHVMFDPTSQGFLADMMMVFALNELGSRFLARTVREIIGQRRVVIVNPEVVDKKIAEEIADQIKKGIDPKFAKSYTMVLKNLAEETGRV